MERQAHSKLLKLAVAATLALALAACSASSQAGVATLDEGEEKTDSASAADKQDAEEELLKWVECMRENGIDIPDPNVDEDGNMTITRRAERPAGGEGEGPAGGTVRLGDEFRKAREECGDPPRLAGRGPSEADVKELQENALKLADCMREQGIADFPDPDFSDFGPGAGPREGVRVGPFGDIDMDDPDVREAFDACREELPQGPFMVGGAPRSSADR